MRILNQAGEEIVFPGHGKGYLRRERVEIARHPAVEAVAEQSHFEVLRTYPNGGQDVKKVVDVPGVTGRAAWVEYEDILRFFPYADEVLAELQKPTPQEDTDALLLDHELRLTMLELGETGNAE